MNKSFFVRLAAMLSPLMASLAFAVPVHAVAINMTNVTPTSTFANVSTVYSADFDTTVYSIDACTLSVDGVDHGSMTLSGNAHHGTAKATYTITAAGSHTVRITCSDTSAGATQFSEATVTVTQDTTAPVVGAFTLVPPSPIAGTAFTIQTNYSDTAGSGINTCGVTIDGSEQGLMSLSNGVGSTNGTASLGVTVATTGTHSVLVNCIDRAGNSGTRTESVSVGPTVQVDTSAPSVDGIAPASATINTNVTISATYSDNVGVTSCSLYANGNLVGDMTLAGSISGTAYRSYTFGSTGLQPIEVRCADAAGNIGHASASVYVTATATPYARQLVKLICPAGYIAADHPCKAVYYVTSDGKRHAFPNEKVYFTWYADFSGVIQIDGTAMAGIPLGPNATYHPGSRMVKFTTLNRTYAVSRYGTLRWVTTEAVAAALYGPYWNTQIDDINDAFYSNYRFGADINSSSDYSPSAEANAVTSLDLNF
jgi:hypothetical protein